MSILICAHAGAWNTSNESIIMREKSAVIDAVQKGCQENSVMEAVLSTVCSLEDNPYLDAGIGSFLQMDGVARADAAIATNNNSYNKKYSGVIQISGIKNPCLVAKKILDYGYHSILSGDHATAFAKEEGFEVHDLKTPETILSYNEQAADIGVSEGERPTYQSLSKRGKELDKKKLSTVGAVGVDTENKIIVSVTSTGGLYYGYPGRVGDTGIFGHGIFCDNHIAVACTGEGDKMIQQMTAAKVGFFYAQSYDIQKSVELAVEDLKVCQDGECGIIAVDINGNIGIAKSTSFLATHHDFIAK